MHGFCSESEQTYQNRVKLPIDTIDDIVLALEIIGWIYFPPKLPKLISET